MVYRLLVNFFLNPFMFLLCLFSPVHAYANVSLDQKTGICLAALDDRGDVHLDQTTGVIVVHLWASWCGYCRFEHQMWEKNLVKLDGVSYYGVTFRDRPQSTRAFLADHGDPFDRHLFLNAREAKKIQARMVPDTLIFVDGVLKHRYKGFMKKEEFEDMLLMKLSNIVERYAASHNA